MRVASALLVLLSAVAPAFAASGGPDAGGYIWRDSREPGVSPDAAAFVGITTSVTTFTDESVTAIPLPFPFPYYGLVGATTLYLSDNGWISLVDPLGNAAPVRVGMPDPAPPNGVVAFYWDSLDPTAGFASHGDIAGGYAVVLRAFQAGALVQLQVEFYMTGVIRVAWQAIGDNTKVTVGIEDESGARGTQLVRDGIAAPGFSVAGGTAVEFLPPSKLSCPAAPAACGFTTSSTTTSGTSVVSGYSCAAGTFSGNEVVFPFDVAATSSLTASITGFAPRNLGVFLLRNCHEAFCLVGGGTTLSVPVLAPGRYRIVVDGATPADDGAFSLTVGCAKPLAAVHSGWKQNRDPAPLAAVPPFTTRGDPAEFAFAKFPSKGDPGWTPTADPNFVSFNRPSILTPFSCGGGLDFTYYTTCLYLPPTISSLVVSAAAVDDGIAVRVNGTLVSTGKLGAYTSPNLATNPALSLGNLNDIEVIHVDDCKTVSALTSLTFRVDGQTALASLVETCQVQAAVTPVAGTVCGGNPVTLDASPSVSGLCSQPLQYRWRIGTTPLTGFTVNPMLSVTPAATTTYTVDVLCPDGCGCQASTDLVVNVSPALLHAVPASLALCGAPSGRLGGTPTASGGIAPLQYLWSPASFLDDATLANPTATPPATQAYTLEVTDAAGCKLTTIERVDVGGGVPASLGNTLLAVRKGADAEFVWIPDGLATSYNLKSEASKMFAAPGLVLGVPAPQATHTGIVIVPPPLVFYRTTGVGCGGEGP